MHQRLRSRTTPLLGVCLILACHHYTPPKVMVMPSNLRLAQTVEQYVGSSGGQSAFRTLAQSFVFDNANESIALAPAGPLGGGGTCPSSTVAIGVTPADGSQGLDHKKNSSDLDGTNGYAMVRVRALDSQCGSALFSMAPRAVYYAVARVNPGYGTGTDTLKYELRMIDSASVTDVTAQASPTHRFDFRTCDHPGSAHANPKARFKAKADECIDHDAQSESDGSDGSDGDVTRMVLDATDTAVWIACSNDCCYADPPPLMQSPSPSLAPATRKKK